MVDSSMITANSLITANAAAIIVFALVAVAEWWQKSRTASVAKLAFGPTGQPVIWAKTAPLLRMLSMSILAWGLTILICEPAGFAEVEPSPEASKHVLVCLDSSPSMFISDSGTRQVNRGEYQQRLVRAGEVMQSILDRLDGENTRVTVFGVYTKAVPIVEETFDKNVVHNLFDGLPVYSAFPPGATQLSSSISDAIEYARRWPDNSALLVVVSDGDSTDATPIRAIPKAISDTLVIGFGQTGKATSVGGHPSRQDADSLRSLASQLRGTYFDGNTRHLPSELLDRLSVIQPRVADRVGLREAAVAAIGIGSLVLALLLPALSLWGVPKQQSYSSVSESGATI